MNYKDLHLDRGNDYDASISSSAFDSYMAFWEEKHIRKIVKAQFGGAVGRYLDFACGTGRITQVIAEYANDIIGIDVSQSMLEVARSKLPCAEFVKADLTSEKVDLGQFDLISSFRFFGNAEPALRLAALLALNPLLKARGYLLVNNHRNPLALLSLVDRLRGGTLSVDLTYRSLTRLLRNADFTVVAAYPIGAWQFRYALAARAGTSPKQEAFLERIFSSGLWATIAPDTIVLARKNEAPQDKVKVAGAPKWLHT